MANVPTYRVTLEKSKTLRVSERKMANSSTSAARVATAAIGMSPVERMIVIGLDSECRVLGVVDIAQGGIHACAATPADVLRAPILLGCTAFVIAHNHPSGNPQPSREDIEFTKRISAGAKVLGLDLVDHIVIGVEGGGFSSLLETGAIS